MKSLLLLGLMLFVRGSLQNTLKRSFVCGGQGYFTADTGEIVSHSGFYEGRNYGKHYDCMWYIQAPDGLHVQLIAEAFDVHMYTTDIRETCIGHDYLELFDGNGTTSRSLGRFCGHEFSPISSSGNMLTLRFVTDDSQQDTGFKLFYNFTTEIIRTCPGDKFQCTNNRCINIEYECDNEDDCGDDSDELYCDAPCHPSEYQCRDTVQCVLRSFMCDGTSDCPYGDDELLSVCEDVLHTCPDTYFQCVGDQTCVARAWMCDGDDDCEDGSDEVPLTCAIETTNTAGCGEKNITGSQGTITSPNYPSNYTTNANCFHIIQAPAGTSAITFQFDELFKLEYVDDDCDYDYILISGEATGDEHGPYCGSTSPGQVIVAGDRAYVMFISDFSGQDIGYSVTWNAGACPDGGFQCGNDNSCVPQAWVCDGEADCGDDSDENNCPTPAT